MKKLMTALLFAALLGGAVTGCSSGSGAVSATESGTEAAKSSEKAAAAGSEKASETEKSKTAGDVTIWYYWETEGHQKALNHIIEEFNGSQSEVKVQAKYVPFADFKKQLSIGASADELPDLVILDNPDHASYAAMGIFAASGLGGENYAVIAGGNEEGAVQFLKYATSEETCLYMMNAMGYISSDSVIAKKQFKGDPVYDAFVEEMQYANARGPLPEWPDISDAISLAFNEVMTDSGTPEEAAAKAQAVIDGIIKK